MFVHKDRPAGIQNPTHWDLISSSSSKIVPPLCYRPAVFFHSLRFIVLSFPKIQSGAVFKISYLTIFTLFFNCVSLKFGNFKLQKSGSVLRLNKLQHDPCSTGLDTNDNVNCSIDSAVPCEMLSQLLIKLYDKKSGPSFLNNLSSATCFVFVSYLQAEYTIVSWTIHYNTVRCFEEI